MNLKRLIIYFAAILLLGACHNSSQENQGSASKEAASTIPEDFQLFYDQFHRDTAFQLTHISFPLEGIPANADTLPEGSHFRWQKETWQWHKPMDPALTSYNRHWQVIADGMVIEKIVEETSGIGMERRFVKMDTDWMLIYYAAMNPMQ